MASAHKPASLGAHDDHRDYLFPGRTIGVPRPLEFAREAFSAAGEEHEQLLARFCHSAWFPHEDRETLSTSDCVAVAAGLVMRFADGALIQKVTVRGAVVKLMGIYRGVCLPLFACPREDWLLPVVVSGFGAVSLNFVRVQQRPSRATPRLSVVERDVVVEPEDQATWSTEGAPRSTITEWYGPGYDEPRYAWVPTPEEPLDEVELIDRVAHTYHASIVRRVREHLERGFAAQEILVTLLSTICCGDILEVQGRDRVRTIAADHPTLGRAIERDVDPRRVPVFIVTERYGGVRWLVLQEGGAMGLEASGALTARTMKPVDPHATLEFGPPYSQRPYRRSDGIEGEVEDLVSLTEAGAKAEMILAGFEPSGEEAHGPGIRSTVVSAIAARRAST